jgi:hypothetical protein
MAVALAQRRAGLEAESTYVETVTVAVQVRTVLMLAEYARRGPVVIRSGIRHGRYCTAVADAAAWIRSASPARKP